MEESLKKWPQSTLEAQNLLLFLKRISWFSRLSDVWFKKEKKKQTPQKTPQNPKYNKKKSLS